MRTETLFALFSARKMATAHASVSDIRPTQLGQPAKQLRRSRQVKQLSFSAVCRTQSRNVRYLGIVMCHIEGDTCLVAMPPQAFEWSAKAHACSAQEMTVASALLIAQALFWVVDHENWSRSFKVLEVMGKSSRSARTQSRTIAKLVPVLCERPFPDDWKSPDTSRNAESVSANLFEVLSAIKQTPVLSIFRVSLSLYLSLAQFLSLSLSMQVCAVSWFAWKWRMALAWQPDLQVWWFWKKRTVWTVSLGLLSAAKFRPSSDTPGALRSVLLVTRPCCCRCCKYKLTLGQASFQATIHTMR